jgi:hypothetical protein
MGYSHELDVRVVFNNIEIVDKAATLPYSVLEIRIPEIRPQIIESRGSVIKCRPSAELDERYTVGSILLFDYLGKELGIDSCKVTEL